VAYVTFLWHLHQPAYRTADGVSHAPWTAAHAGGSYRTLAGSIRDTGSRGQVLNIVPTLYEQLEAYSDGTVVDPVLQAVTRPVGDLDRGQRQVLLEWAFHVTPRQLERYQRLRELASRRSTVTDQRRLSNLFSRGDLRDLQTLFILAQAGEQAWRDERLGPLCERGRHFTSDHHRAAAGWLSRQPGELIQLWHDLAGQDGVEISTSPFAHPIMPLLIDSSVVEESWAPQPPPRVPAFRRPQDARQQLDAALHFMRQRSFNPTGCWPPEGSVSTAALDTYAGAGVRWLVTDEGILERSLGEPLRSGDATREELYRPWRLAPAGPILLFRDRRLSDRIGFVYGNWDDETRAAHDMLAHLANTARKLPPEACITIALDGENPWLHYPQGGGTFLRELLEGLDSGRAEVEPITPDELCSQATPSSLPRLHPGSWINSIFATWIGHPEKTRAWEVLASVRAALPDQAPLPPSMLLAEGSDWFWWLGDDNPTPLAPLYDRIFRLHLKDACVQGGIEPPQDLEQPLKAVTYPLRVPVSNHWAAPRLDGEITTYFEWSPATWIRASDGKPLQRLAVWAGFDRLHLLIEGERAMHRLVNGQRLSVRLMSPEGAELAVTLPTNGRECREVQCALGRVAELSLPWDAREGHRLEVRLGSSSLPEGAVILIEPWIVDEEVGVRVKRGGGGG
jgi:alpha-amylase/alpha-mannosidase (GH57 family)